MYLNKAIIRRSLPFMVGSMLPLLLSLIIVNILRLDTHIGGSKLLGDLLAFCAYMFMGLGILSFVQNLRKYRIFLVLLSTLTILFVMLEVSAFIYFKETGSLPGVEAISYLFQNAKEMRPILLDSLGVKHLLGFIFLSFVVYAPVFIDKKVFTEQEFPVSIVNFGRKFLILSAALFFTALFAMNLDNKNQLVGLAKTAVVFGSVEYGFNFDIEKSVYNSEAPEPAKLIKNGKAKYKNAVFIVLESTRADVLKTYGGKQGASPYLDEISSDSVVIPQMYSPVTHSSKALTTIFCGINSFPSSLVRESIPGTIPAPCMAELLNEEGYSTLFMQSAEEFFESRRTHTINMGFKEFVGGNELADESQKLNYFGYPDEVMLPAASKWLGELENDKPFFASFFTVVAHHPYRTPDSFSSSRKVFEGGRLRNDYYNSILYQDRFIENLIKIFKDSERYKETLFIIVGDHGEGLMEHNKSAHNLILEEEGVRVPLLLYGHEIKKHLSAPRFRMSQLDIMPMVLELLGYDLTGGYYEGVPLSKVNRERTIFLNCFYAKRCRGQIEGPHKYILNYNRDPQMYNLELDPLEKNNIASKNQKLVENAKMAVEAKMAKILHMWLSHKPMVDIKSLLKPWASLNESDFEGFDMSGMNLDHASFRDSDFTDANLEGGSFEDARFDNSKIVDVNLKNSNLKLATFARGAILNSDLSGSNMYRARVLSVHFDSSNLDNSNIAKADLLNSHFVDTSMEKTVFDQSLAKNTTFEDIKLRNATFVKTRLVDTKFINVDFENVDFRAICDRITFKDVTFDKNTKFSKSCDDAVKMYLGELARQ